ncbi:MAG: type IV pilus modification protein PilV [Methylococcales bacterium]|nr:type IV pilus modification protein PilV [Methylococcales bacterium]
MFKSRGFTLIEVLISMVILAIGLLGLAAMQAISLRDNQDAYYYQQATLLAYEMQDRIMVNQHYWANNPIPSASTTASCRCLASPCTGCSEAQMAANDYQYWLDSVTKIFPAPKGTNVKRVDIQLSSAVTDVPRGACNGTNTKTTTLCLIIHWGRTNVRTTGKLSGDASFYLEVTPS